MTLTRPNTTPFWPSIEVGYCGKGRHQIVETGSDGSQRWIDYRNRKEALAAVEAWLKRMQEEPALVERPARGVYTLPEKP